MSEAPQGNKPFAGGSPEAKAILAWWHSLHGDETRDGDKGELAELRRASTLTEVVLSRAYQRLRHALLEAGVFRGDCEYQAAAVARVLARVKSAVPGLGFARIMAEDKTGKPRISEARFKRLLREQDRGQLASDLIRLLPMLENRADPVRLAGDIWLWGEGARRAWANDYYLEVFRKKETTS